jgi:endonuclease YncB( thermonuclease family)
MIVRMRPALAILVALVPAVAIAADAAPVAWRVVSVHDGDTLSAVDATNTQHKVRLQGIDAPEVKQPFGTKSRDRLADLTLRKVVRVNVHNRDQYGRLLADIEAAGQSVNRQMVADGMAWHYARYRKDAGLASAERAARSANRGPCAGKGPDAAVGVAGRRVWAEARASGRAKPKPERDFCTAALRPVVTP